MVSAQNVPAFPNDSAGDDLRDQENDDKLGRACAGELRNDETECEGTRENERWNRPQSSTDAGDVGVAIEKHGL